MIPADDSVCLLSAFVEGMELSDLYASYGRIRKNQASPRQLFKIMIYASMNRIYSSRDIETACKRDINFMYLLEGMPAPDQATIARFISLHFAECSKKTLAKVTGLLYELGEISRKSIFIDGTKIESCANKYSFVRKRLFGPLSRQTLLCLYDRRCHQVSKNLGALMYKNLYGNPKLAIRYAR